MHHPARLALPVLLLLGACAEDAPRPMPAPILVAEAPSYITAFAVDDDFVYWGDAAGGETSGDARLVRAPHTGGPAEVLSTGDDVVPAILSGAATLYWAEGDGSFQCGRLRAMNKASGMILTLADAQTSCNYRPLDEYKGKLLALVDDPGSPTRPSAPLALLARFDPTGATRFEPSVHFDDTIEPRLGQSRTGPSLYLAHRGDCGLRVFRADLDSFDTVPAFTYDLPFADGFVVLPQEGAYWVNQRYVDRSDLHRGFGSGLDEGVVASFEGGVGGTPLVDGDFLWLYGPNGPLRVTRATGATERFTPSVQDTYLSAARPEGLYVVAYDRIYFQPRP